MKRRLFIAVPLSEELKDAIGEALKNVSFARAEYKPRWAPRENWHVTVVFLSDQEEEVIPAITRALQKAARRAETPRTLEIERIELGPSPRNPSMVWACCSFNTSRLLGKIKKEMEKALAEEGIVWERNSRPFHAHITLARFSTPPRSANAEAIPVGSECAFSSLDLMESTLAPGGATYRLVERIGIGR